LQDGKRAGVVDEQRRFGQLAGGRGQPREIPLREKYVLRRMIIACTEVVSRAYEHQGEVDQLLDEVERDILHISGERVTANAPTMKELVHRAIHHIEMYHQRQGQLGGIATGFVDLDKLTDGLHGGEMIVIAARPSMGKTSLAMNVSEHVAVELKLPVGVIFPISRPGRRASQELMAVAKFQKSIRENLLARCQLPPIIAGNIHKPATW